MRYYQRRLLELERRRTALLVLAVVASGVGTMIAAAGAETWVALTTAVAAAPLAYLAHLQVDTTIVAYNQSAARLEGLMRRWHGRPAQARSSDSEAFGELVREAEAALAAEHGGWVEQMTEALHELQERQQREQRPRAE